jgi:hypothetical protein
MQDGSCTGLGVEYRAKSDENIIQAQAERERQITKRTRKRTPGEVGLSTPSHIPLSATRGQRDQVLD